MTYFDTCLTYLLVEIKKPEAFDLRDFCEKLSLDYDLVENFSTDENIELGRNEFFDMDINVMLRETLADLFGKEDILVSLAEKYKLEYTLERVPLIPKDEVSRQMRLSLDRDIIEFLYKTHCRDDLDYFVL